MASVAYGKVLHMQVKLMASQLVEHQVHCRAPPNVVKGLGHSCVTNMLHSILERRAVCAESVVLC